MLLIAIGLLFGLVMLLWCFVLSLLWDDTVSENGERPFSGERRDTSAAHSRAA
jgi:hypothetical protein